MLSLVLVYIFIDDVISMFSFHLLEVIKFVFRCSEKYLNSTIFYNFVLIERTDLTWNIRDVWDI